MSSPTLRFAMLALALSIAPLVHAEHPPSDDRRSGSEYRGNYDDRDQAYRDPPRYDEAPRYGRSLHDDVHDAIASALGAEAGRIRIAVRGGYVTLSGSVRDARARRVAHDAAHDVPGVQGVSMRALYVGSRRY